MLNIYDATTKEKREMVEIKNDEMAYRRRQQNEAQLSDLVLVRTTNQFPKYGIVETTDKYTPPVLEASLFEKELEEAGLNSEEYKMYSFMSRRTTHWTLNGLVGSHMYGDFQGRDFIIIEPFEEHIHDEGLLNINEADTWFERDLKLSDRAVILIPAERYQELCKDEAFKKEISKFNIALFKGDENLALKMLLNDKGYIWADIGQWGFSWDRDTATQEFAGKLENLQEQIAKELTESGRQVSYGGTHANSKSIMIDREKMQELEEQRISDFVDYIAENTSIKFFKAYLKEFLRERRYRNVDKNSIYVTEWGDEDPTLPNLSPQEIFEMLGSKKLLELTQGFNEEVLQEHRKAREKKDAEILERLNQEMQEPKIDIYSESLAELNSKMITGLTYEVEGDIELDGVCYATTAIGRVRLNQEDGVLLIKDENLPDFKMLAVADGMGGAKGGELASHIIIDSLKEWFKNLSQEEKQCYYTGVANLQESLQEELNEISEVIFSQLKGLGGTTIVCAVVGENDTLIANVGDSRAYIVKEGRLKETTQEDSIVQEKFNSGKIPSKEAMRFHEESSLITQAVGVKMENIHFRCIKNDEYDMILLFSDGVTDCLSEEDIAVICRKTDKADLAKRIVKKSIEHDSVVPEELYIDYNSYNMYIPGGKDNTTAAIYIPEKIDKDEEER